MLKLIEIIILGTDNGLEEFFPRYVLQFGFTQDLSPDMAVLIISECIAEAKILKELLSYASLDARKAFDVVNRFLLKNKLSGGSHACRWESV